MNMRLLAAFAVACLVLVGTPLTRAADLVTLNEENFDAMCAPGGEADAILGDYAMRNDKISLVIGNPELLSGRSASRSSLMWFDGCIIDMTLRGGECAKNDRLGWFWPGPRLGPNQPDSVTGRALYKPDYSKDFPPQTGKSVKLVFIEKSWKNRQIPSRTEYTLEDGNSYVICEVIYFNPVERPEVKRIIPAKPPAVTEADLIDGIATEQDPKMKAVAMPDENVPPPPPGPAGGSMGISLYVPGVGMNGDDTEQDLAWSYDPWFGQAYAVLSEKHATHRAANGKDQSVPAEGNFTLQPGAELRVVRRVFVGANLFDVRRDVNAFLKLPRRAVTVRVTSGGAPLAGATVTAIGAASDKSKVGVYASGRTDSKGLVIASLPPGAFELRIAALGREEKRMPVAGGDAAEVSAELGKAALVRIEATDDTGGAIPCKAEVRGRDGTHDPYFFPDTGSRLVRNLIYTPDGKATQEIPPGKYEVIITRGPEYDMVTQAIEVAAGGEAIVRAKLTRSVDTKGWVSVDPHGYSTISNKPAGSPPSAAEAQGRVLNLLGEGIEFAPSTELNRAFTYQPIIDSLGAQKWLRSPAGIALNDGGRKYAYNEQYAFPIEYHPRQQDGGVPQRPQHCMQINWLLSWGVPIDPENPWAAAKQRGYEKCLILMQPDNDFPKVVIHDRGTKSSFNDGDMFLYYNDDSAHARPLFRDTDDDGVPDRVTTMFSRVMDALDVRTLEPLIDSKAHVENDVLHWLMMRATGERMPGVISSHATDNFHGSGGVRTYVQSDTDDPTKLDSLAIRREIRKSHAVMTTGPFLEATLTTAEGHKAIVGDTVKTKADHANLRVKVQCPNWITLDRVEFWVNGMVDASRTLDRTKSPERFGTGVVQCDQTIKLPIANDSQVVVIARGHGPNLRRRSEKDTKETQHVAITNPISIDLGGDGMTPIASMDETIQVEPKLLRPVVSKKGNPPGVVRLTITNHGKSSAKGAAKLVIRPSGLVGIDGASEIPFNLPAGEKSVVDVKLKLVADPDTESLLAGRKLKSTLYVVRDGHPPGIAPGKVAIDVDSTATLMNEDEVRGDPMK